MCGAFQADAWLEQELKGRAVEQLGGVPGNSSSLGYTQCLRSVHRAVVWQVLNVRTEAFV